MDREFDQIEKKLSVWKEHYQTEIMIRIAGELPLRRDMFTLLKFVNENKVVGTQSTGNMPLKMVREVTAKFVNPPELDEKIGDRIYSLRSEADIWPLYFLHIIAEVGELLSIAPARRWRLTKDGERFLNVDPLWQVSFLLTIWWYSVNWLVAYPYSGMGDDLPPFFNYHVLEKLLSLRQNTRVLVDEFSDDLIRKTGLVWGAPDSDYAGRLLQGSIERMVIYILRNFGVVECEYREEPMGKGTISRLHTFKIVPFGRALLESLAVMSQ
ncbi:MAG: hypothetical protein ISR58_12470 [Anaerolineales bacterium]|nr:hypothetical protein [Chloroflexota bacterium]MBL6981993.1 hypothetical protein [Anaerolineales bacterium]